MDPVKAAEQSAPVIVGLPAGFMLDAATYARGAELGFDGIDFYVAGRGGALGDVDGAVVAASFVFFHPPTIVERWNRGRAVMAPIEAAHAFASCLDAWAAEHLADGVDYATLASLEGRVIAAASPAGAPLFAAWSSLPEPTDPRTLALHRMNILREWRGALH
ncbi:MAG: helix-turn-helix domain-containing protein, partial [Acidimicrobiales bacterium]